MLRKNVNEETPKFMPYYRFWWKDQTQTRDKKNGDVEKSKDEREMRKEIVWKSKRRML